MCVRNLCTFPPFWPWKKWIYQNLTTSYHLNSHQPSSINLVQVVFIAFLIMRIVSFSYNLCFYPCSSIYFKKSVRFIKLMSILGRVNPWKILAAFRVKPKYFQYLKNLSLPGQVMTLSPKPLISESVPLFLLVLCPNITFLLKHSCNSFFKNLNLQLFYSWLSLFPFTAFCLLIAYFNLLYILFTYLVIFYFTRIWCSLG